MFKLQETFFQLSQIEDNSGLSWFYGILYIKSVYDIMDALKSVYDIMDAQISVSGPDWLYTIFVALGTGLKGKIEFPIKRR